MTRKPSPFPLGIIPPKNGAPVKARALALTVSALCAGPLLMLPPQAAVAASGDSAGQTTFDFAIAKGSLSSALLQFSETTGKKVLFNADLVRGRGSAGLNGRYSAEQALHKLLSGTPIVARSTPNGTVTLEKTQRDPVPVSGSHAMPPVTVTAQAGYEADDPYNPDYNRTVASTATKTDTPVMETPVSIQVVPQPILKDQQIIKLDDALKNVSGVRRRENAGSGLNEAFVIRGFEINNIYMDGFRLSDLSGPLEFANIERIEVVKGPIGTLFGRIDPGGLVNIVTKRPEFTPSYSLQQQLGSFDTYRTTASATGPIPGLDNVAYRMDFSYQQADSFVDFVDKERYFVAPVLTWNLTDATRATLKLQYTHNDQTPINPIFVPGAVLGTSNRVPDVRRSNFTGRKDDFFTSDRFIFGFEGTHDFNDNWRLRLAYNGQKLDNDQQQTFCCGGPGNFFVTPTRHGLQTFIGPDAVDTHSVTAELSGKFETVGLRHNTLLGWEYYDHERQNLFRQAVLGDNPGAIIDIFNPVSPTFPLIFSNQGTSEQFQRWHGYYVQDQIELPYNVNALLGGRFDAAEGGFSNDTGFKVDVQQENFSPRAGLLWQIVPQLAIFGSYAESFGVENLFASDRNGKALDPEESEQWELGLKTELLGGKLTGMLAYYNLTRNNIATPDPNPDFAGQGFSVATGQVRHQGVELDLAGEILPGWNVVANYAYLDSEITADNDPAKVGNRFHGTPRHIGNMFTSYQFQDELLKGLKIGGGGRAVGKFPGTDTNSFVVQGYIIANVMAAYEWKLGNKQKLTAQLNVENLLDKKFVDFTTSGFKDFFWGAPRTFLGSIRIDF